MLLGFNNWGTITNPHALVEHTSSKCPCTLMHILHLSTYLLPESYWQCITQYLLTNFRFRLVILPHLMWMLSVQRDPKSLYIHNVLL